MQKKMIMFVSQLSYATEFTNYTVMWCECVCFGTRRVENRHYCL
ncbi:hypothetical protein TRIP_D250048 [uncultured Paludibacter sp.]|uniref:Uncharacterized protein n=1 Tax=uncultured Paludibacter sp. TaxID=497635 RepID=A0A653A9H7_9BACT|nr:hypothetical protein TRIP_D250048 [uncultured Paludibacter sp.]